ncbi:MAG: alcohol dehydrogenase [Planctomycetota bacterium]|nr:MAG: alcohol dehydrogenase [Planctomycetota bacterium]
MVRHMQAVVFYGDGDSRVTSWPKPQVQSGTALLRVEAAALNRRDLWIVMGRYPGVKPPVVLGSDAVGVVEAVANDANREQTSWCGQRVVVNPSLGWGADQHRQGPDFEILGSPRQGTFAQWVVVPLEALHPAPKHLDLAQCAALPLAGLTAYRALFTRACVQPEERVLITGIGGGVAQMALSFARALGCRIAVTSADAAKRQAALQAGADWAGDYTDPHWSAALQQEWGGVDVIIDGSAGPGLAQALEAADYGARVVIYGGTAGTIDGIPPRVLFWKQLTMLGTTMGSDADFAAMLRFVHKHQLPIVVDQTYPLDQWPQALQRLRSSAQTGKVVLRMSDE